MVKLIQILIVIAQLLVYRIYLCNSHVLAGRPMPPGIYEEIGGVDPNYLHLFGNMGPVLNAENFAGAGLSYAMNTQYSAGRPLPTAFLPRNGAEGRTLTLDIKPIYENMSPILGNGRTLTVNLNTPLHAGSRNPENPEKPVNGAARKIIGYNIEPIYEDADAGNTRNLRTEPMFSGNRPYPANGIISRPYPGIFRPIPTPLGPGIDSSPLNAEMYPMQNAQTTRVYSNYNSGSLPSTTNLPGRTNTGNVETSTFNKAVVSEYQPTITQNENNQNEYTNTQSENRNTQNENGNTEYENITPQNEIQNNQNEIIYNQGGGFNSENEYAESTTIQSNTINTQNENVNTQYNDGNMLNGITSYHQSKNDIINTQNDIINTQNEIIKTQNDIINSRNEHKNTPNEIENNQNLNKPLTSETTSTQKVPENTQIENAYNPHGVIDIVKSDNNDGQYDDSYYDKWEMNPNKQFRPINTRGYFTQKNNFD